ncbi:MAG: hypothetical protein AB1765_05270 [Candidatus Hydrogenedentota bacterium]
MPGIKDYLTDFENCINEAPYRLTSKLEIEDRGGIIFRIKGKIVFRDNSELHIKDKVVASDMPYIQKVITEIVNILLETEL